MFVVLVDFCSFFFFLVDAFCVWTNIPSGLDAVQLEGFLLILFCFWAIVRICNRGNNVLCVLFLQPGATQKLK